MNATWVGLEVIRARRAAGLTQAELAARLGTTQSAVARAETGRCLPSLRFIARVADATGQRILLRFPAGEPSRSELRRRSREALGDFKFDPLDRDPTDIERRFLSGR